MDIPAPERVIVNDGAAVEAASSSDQGHEIRAGDRRDLLLQYRVRLSVHSARKADLLQRQDAATRVTDPLGRHRFPAQESSAYETDLTAAASASPNQSPISKSTTECPMACASPGWQEPGRLFYNPNPAEFGIARQVNRIGRSRSGMATARFASRHLSGIRQLKGRVKLIFTTAVEGMPEDRRKHAPDAGSCSSPKAASAHCHASSAGLAFLSLQQCRGRLLKPTADS